MTSTRRTDGWGQQSVNDETNIAACWFEACAAKAPGSVCVFFFRDACTPGLNSSDASPLSLPRRQIKFTPLHHACDKGHRDVAEILIKFGADPNAKDGHGATPVHWAAGSGDGALLNLLLAHKGYVHEEDANGATPLHWAATKGRTHLVDILLERGAPLEQVDHHFLTPLHRAVLMGHTECVAQLLREGASPSRQDCDGNTALHLACEIGQVGAVRAILSSGVGAGAAFGTINRAGLTPLGLVERGHKGALPLLLEFKERLTVDREPPKLDIAAHILGRSKNGDPWEGSSEGGDSLTGDFGGFGVTVDGEYIT